MRRAPIVLAIEIAASLAAVVLAAYLVASAFLTAFGPTPIGAPR